MLAQTDVRAIEALERIATSQIIMAVAILLVGLVVIAGTGYFFMQIRALRAAIRENLDDVKPRVIPLIDRAKSVTDDVAGMTDNVRRKVDDVLHTLEDLRRALEEGGEAAQKRVRRFGKVLDVVQSETEDLLLDAAAAARGVHATTRMLRRGRKPRRLLKRRRRPKGED